MTAPPAATRTDASLHAVTIGDATQWDESVLSLGGHLLQTWRWGEFKARHGWKPLRLAIVDDERPVAVGQVLYRQVGPFSVAYVPRGPVGCHQDRRLLAAFTFALDKVNASRRAAAVFIEPECPVPTAALGGDLGWTKNEGLIQPLRTIKVHVDASDEEILGRMKSKTRYNVRLAERRGVTVRRGGRSDLASFYAMLQETGSRDEFGIHSVEYYDDMIRALGDDLALFVAEFEGVPAAAVLIVKAGDEAIYMYGASASQYQRHMPAYLVQFRAMQWAREHGCRLYDLWGIPSEAEQREMEDTLGEATNVRTGMWGVYRFKQGFGGDVVSYPGVYERIYMKHLVRAWRRLRPSIV